jgi:hypothetical protein
MTDMHENNLTIDQFQNSSKRIFHLNISFNQIRSEMNK